jgi:hypothetical protein
MKTLCVVVVAMGVAGVSWADGPGGEGLGGPKVEAKASARASLVDRDFNGKVKRLEVPAEEEALGLVELSAEERARVDGVLAARASTMDEIVKDNLLLLGKVHTAVQGGDRAEIVGLLGEVREAMEPMRARGTLMEELQDALPNEKAKRVKVLAKEYREALYAEMKAAKEAGGERLRLREFVTRETLAELGGEIKRAYERTLGASQANFERVLAKLELRPEQETKIRNMAVRHVEETKGKATRAQNVAFVLRVMRELDAGQRKRLMEAFDEGM